MSEDIKSNLMRMENNKEPENMHEKEPIPEDSTNKNEAKVFIDATIYTVMLDSNMKITDVINHTISSITDEDIEKIAENILNNKEIKESYIGNLYTNKYSYSFNKNHTALVIIDNANYKEVLIKTLKTSVLIFCVLEFVIIVVSNELTKWLIKPVEETFEKQKQFVLDASHELKTPLSVIMASVDILETEPNEKKWIQNIKEETERMNNLIKSLLEMAKSENVIKEEHVKEDLSKLVRKTVLTFEGLGYEKNIKFNCKIEDDINFLCNGEQVKQLVSILIDNAIKHSFVNEEVEVNLKKDKGNIILSITNKGNDIPKEKQKKIFERFYRADESRNRDENRYGLGLAIAKNIVTNHKGKILVNSDKGVTTFKVVF